MKQSPRLLVGWPYRDVQNSECSLLTALHIKLKSNLLTKSDDRIKQNTKQQQESWNDDKEQSSVVDRSIHILVGWRSIVEKQIVTVDEMFEQKIKQSYVGTKKTTQKTSKLSCCLLVIYLLKGELNPKIKFVSFERTLKITE